MATSQPNNPSYVSQSSVGFHITDPQTWIRTSHLAPVSQDPDRRHWTTQEGADQITQMFPHTPAGIVSLNLFIYNKSRDTDRICPSCRRWYKVGESEHRYESFDEFLRRDYSSSPTINTERREEQNLSGLCSQFCMDALVEDPDDAERNSGKELRRSGSWLMRRTTIAEEAEGGVKVKWERIGNL